MKTIIMIYLFWVKLIENIDVTVGALGKQHFQLGYYAYVGSAQRAWRSRLQRHFEGSDRLHWHIDYLRAVSDPLGVALKKAPKVEECRLAQQLKQLEGVRTPVKGFGSSDCHCKTHLFYFGTARPILIDHPDLLDEDLQALVSPRDHS